MSGIITYKNELLVFNRKDFLQKEINESKTGKIDNSPKVENKGSE